MRRPTLGPRRPAPPGDAAPGRRTTRRQRPAIETLEDRSLLSVTIRIDYSYDINNFFNTQARRDLLQLAADSIAVTLNDSLAAIAPNGFNTWDATFPHPGTGQVANISNLVVPADTLIIYAGGRSLAGGSEAGEGSTGGYSASGDTNWLNTVQARGQAGALANPKTDYSTWGGSISFDTSGQTNWYFGQSLAGLTSSQTDFLSVAQHEIAHVLGLGTADSWYARISGGAFRGPNAMAAYGQPVPVNSAGDHWANSVRSDGVPALMTPVLVNGTRGLATALDFAALRDIGWQVTTTPATIEFAATSYTVAEGAGTATITVSRAGGLGPATVRYRTANGTATAGPDYAAATGTLSFGFGEVSKSFSINVVNDAIPEGVETVSLFLEAPTGAILGGRSQSVLTITDAALRAPVDFDPDGRTDLAVFRPNTAQWFARGSGPGRLLGVFGGNGFLDIPVPGDYDGDGRTEMAVFRPSTAQWFVLGPTGGRLLGTFGATNLFDIPVPGDYDGDGITDLAVFRVTTAEWFVRGPNGGYLLGNFGGPNMLDIPAPGDYDGDGRTDMAVFRPGTAQWFYRGPDGSRALGSFGATGLFDLPAPGDYDGDGITEPAVFRPSTAQWFVRGATGSRLLGTFGGTGLLDLPAQTSVGGLLRLGVFGGFASRNGVSAGLSTAAAATTAVAPTPLAVPAPPAETATAAPVTAMLSRWRRRRGG